MPPADVPVLIVGAGPSGTIAALLLEQLGIETLLAERRPGPQRAPAAHVVNARTFEICRAAGVDRKALADASIDPKDANLTCFVTKLGGRMLGQLPFEQQGDDQLAVTPTPLRNLSQNRFEPILFEALQRVAGKAPRWRMQWESAEQTDDGVRSVMRDLDTGREHAITSRYLIAADGAGSRIRKSLGIDLIGPERIQSFIMVHFHARLRGIPGIPPGMLFFCSDPAVGGGAFIVHDPDREAVFMHSFDPDTESLDDYDKARCEGIVRNALEDPDLALSIENVGTWTMTAQVAERYRDRNVFLVGDAAHRFPPTGGLGLNSGVQDAHNLAWKLAAVLQGWASPGVLDSYELERRPVAQNNADQSLRNALRLAQVPQALGISDFTEASRERMQATLADAAGLARVQDAIAAQAEHFDMPGLQLGFCYADGVLVRSDDEPSPGPIDVRVYTPSGQPGARVPHAWMKDDGVRVSLLDLLPLDRFALLAGPDGEAWMDALGQVKDVPITGLRLSKEALPDLDRWLAEAGIEPGGALLVRPDQHVAWRSRGAVATPAQTLVGILRTLLS